MNAPTLLLRWISSFLRDRTVNVRILGHIHGNYGVPQGSPISHLLFLSYMSKLYNTFSLCYSVTSGIKSDLIQSNFQTSRDDLILFSVDYRIRAAPTLLWCYLKGKRATSSNHKISRNGQVIPSSSSVKFLALPLTLLLPLNLTFVLSQQLLVIA